MDAKRYTVTVYAAAPGTVIREFDIHGKEHLTRSVPGHVYYQTDDGEQKRSWGFAPAKLGDIYGRGEPQTNDADAYQDPMYARTLEISKEQFDKLNEFGPNPDRYGFDLTYKDFRNNCVDYTWAALNHAGIQRTDRRFGTAESRGVDGKLNYLPSHAPGDIRTIRDPMPGSDLNQETTRPLPDMAWWQIPLSEAERQPSMEQGDPFDRLVAAANAGDDKAFDDVGRDYLKSYEGQDFLQNGLEHNQQQALTEQMLAQQQQQQDQQQAPSMAMSM